VILATAAVLAIALLVAACGGDTPAPAAPEAKAPPPAAEPDVTVDSIAGEFCDGVFEILDLPPDQWEAQVERLGVRLDLKRVAAGISEEELLDAVLEECEEGMATAFAGAPEPEVPDTPIPEPTPTPEPTATPEPEGPQGLALVELATVQIVAQGTFVDPDTGGVVTGAGAGTGFIVSEDGLVVTNNHVVTGSATLNVFIPGRDEPVNARVVAASECSDLAVIQLPPGDYPYLEFYDGNLTIGTRIFAAGYPLGEPEYALVGGIISKLDADGETSWASVDQVLQHDAAINPGNSGGPLVNEDGQVVGIVYASLLYFNQFFAIGLDQALPVLDQLMVGNNVDWIGINGEAFMGDGYNGLWVFSVESGSQADEAGILPGDFIVAMERLPLGDDGTMRDYCDVLQTRGSDRTMQIELVRFATGEVLEGQLNGRPLAVTSTFGGGEVEVYTYASDDTGVISASVPAAWQLDGAPVAEFSSMAVSPDLASWTAFYQGDRSAADTAGIFIVVVPTGSEIGNADLEEILDEAVIPDNCSYEGRFDYDDGFYAGFFDQSTCDNGGLHIAFAAIDPADPTFAILVEIVEITQDDADATSEFYGTFFVFP
jgi:serine protease Do